MRGNQDLRVVTYNVHQGLKRLTDSSLSDGVLATLKGLRPDFVGLQEVLHPSSHSMLNRWADAMRMEYAFASSTTRAGVRYGNAVLSSLPIHGRRSIPLPVSVVSEPRRLLRVVTGSPERPISVWTTHLGLMPTDRARQARFIVDAMRRDRNNLHILAGDMNILSDSSRAARTFDDFFSAGGADKTYPAWCPILKLDRVYAWPGAGKVRAKAISTKETRRTSDHLPLVATLMLNGDASHFGSDVEY